MREASVDAATVLSRACRFLLLSGMSQEKISEGGRRKIWYKYREPSIVFSGPFLDCPKGALALHSVVRLFGQEAGLCMGVIDRYSCFQKVVIVLLIC